MFLLLHYYGCPYGFMLGVGEKMNFSKSKLYCSLNVSRRDALRFANIYGMAISENLWTYLGVPLMHGRFNKCHVTLL